MKTRILSTKTLLPHQKELLLNDDLTIVEKNFISLIPLEVNFEEVHENIIITSSNTVKFLKKHPKFDSLKTKQIFCVGEKTAAFLKNEGFEVIEKTDYGLHLAQKIVADYPGNKFSFFCGKQRRPELPSYLKKNGINIEEINVYDTKPNPKKLDSKFDGVLFFSPSAVSSYFQSNTLEAGIAFCIGTTTAAEAEKYTQAVKIASKPTVENVIVQVIKNFKKE